MCFLTGLQMNVPKLPQIHYTWPYSIFCRFLICEWLQYLSILSHQTEVQGLRVGYHVTFTPTQAQTAFSTVGYTALFTIPVLLTQRPSLYSFPFLKLLTCLTIISNEVGGSNGINSLWLLVYAGNFSLRLLLNTQNYLQQVLLNWRNW